MMAVAHHEYHKIQGIYMYSTLGFYCLTLLKASVKVEVVCVCSFVQRRSQCHNLTPTATTCVFCVPVTVPVPVYRSMNEAVAQSKICPFEVNTEKERAGLA